MRPVMMVLLLGWATNVGATPQTDAKAWRVVGDALFALAEQPGPTQPVAVRAGWAALRNALVHDPRWEPLDLEYDRPKPRALDADELHLVHELELYERLARGAPDAVRAELVHANVLRHADQFDAATPLYLDIIARYPDHELAEVAANLALDALNRLERYDELVALADRMRVDQALVAHRPQLAQRLRAIQLQSLRSEPAFLEGSHEMPTFEVLKSRAAGYLAAIEPDEPDGDELLYNAMVLYEEAHALGESLEVARRLLAEFPASKLARRTLARAAFSEGALGRFGDAAHDLERAAALGPDEKDTSDALADAILYRIGLGELDRAASDLDTLAKLPHVRPSYVTRATGLLVRAELDAGRPTDARRHAKPLRASDDLGHVELGVLLAELACPVALVDELCPGARDPELVARARSELRRATDADDPTDFGRRVLVDLDFETRGPDLAQRYRELTGDASATRIIAHERLGRLAVRDRDVGAAVAELTLCIREASSGMTGAAWLQRCERERHVLSQSPAPLLEHLPNLVAGGVLALEQP